jgi:hypothetical protein
MTSTLSSTPAKRRTTPHNPGALPRPRQTRAARKRSARRDRQPLGRYTDRQGSVREVVARRGAAGSVLVVDRDGASRGDCRLVAHLGADEPRENAALVCSRYLEDLATNPCRCRALTAEDARSVPFADQLEQEADTGLAFAEEPLVDRLGRRYRLELVHSGMSIPELRWCRSGATSAPEVRTPVSVREAIAAVESYEPVCAQTVRALSANARGGELSTTVLRAELVRVQDSPIVLNRRLREVVLAAVERQELSMSEIAIRCGRVKRDRNGNESGETSWLARRIGLLPEGGRDTPTPWIHSDVLALIARRGLGISPREVEL